jgi:hypothetical protein
MLRRIVRTLLWPNHMPEWARPLGFDQPGALLPFRLMTLGVFFCLTGLLFVATGGFLGPVDVFGWKPVLEDVALVGVALFILGDLLFVAIMAGIIFLLLIGKVR